MEKYSCLEMCAGGGGQALGLEQAGFEPESLVEIDKHCCSTLKANRPEWDIIQESLEDFSGQNYKGVDLLAGGLPCPPFSVAGKQLGKKDERNLFPAAIRLIGEIKPQAIMIENVRGILDPVFEGYRRQITGQIEAMGYKSSWRLLNASDYGVSQLRPRVVFVAARTRLWKEFEWPAPSLAPLPAVGDLLGGMMGQGGWEGASEWAMKANDIAPTIVGGSHKHGGPDLGPTRARNAWAKLGVNGKSIADAPPGPGFAGMPKLTIPMVARLQGFPDDWKFSGRKTAAYKQVGNAFPPPVARAVAMQIAKCLARKKSHPVYAAS